jgi:hypothetical protein
MNDCVPEGNTAPLSTSACDVKSSIRPAIANPVRNVQPVDIGDIASVDVDWWITRETTQMHELILQVEGALKVEHDERQICYAVNALSFAICFSCTESFHHMSCETDVRTILWSIYHKILPSRSTQSIYDALRIRFGLDMEGLGALDVEHAVAKKTVQHYASRARGTPGSVFFRLSPQTFVWWRDIVLNAEEYQRAAIRLTFSVLKMAPDLSRIVCSFMYRVKILR